MKKKFLATICIALVFALITIITPSVSNASASNVEPVGPTHESLESCIAQAQEDDIFLLPTRIEMIKGIRITKNLTFQPFSENGVTNSELVFTKNPGSSTINSVQFNQEEYRHFVIANTGITVTFKGITFSSNGFGGGITDDAIVTSGTTKAKVIFDGCTFTNCEGKDGGAVLAYDTVNYEFKNCVFTSNKAVRGGAIAVKNGGEPKIENCQFVSNEASNYGSAVVVINNHLSYDREVRITDSVFTRNIVRSQNGSLAGAVACVELDKNIPINSSYSKSKGKAYLDNCVFSENIAVVGGVYAPIGSAVSTENMEITIKNTTFRGNVNEGRGTIGAMFPTAEPKLNIENVVVENNFVVGTGGSLYIYSESFFEFKPINSTFGKNYSSSGNEISALGTQGNGNPTVVLTPVGNSVVYEKGNLTANYSSLTLNALPTIIFIIITLGLCAVGVYLLYRFNPKNILGRAVENDEEKSETERE